jgi:hypothetical protein
MRDNAPRGAVFEMEFLARPQGIDASTPPGIDDGRRES